MSKEIATALVEPPRESDIAEIEKIMGVDVRRVVSQAIAIKKIMHALMQPEVHYGVIPGTKKPTLFQPGADKLAVLFRLRTRYQHTRRERGNFISIETRCRLIHIPTGEEWGEGFGSANSREDRYLNQSVQKACPECGQPTIFRSKPRNGEDPKTMGWYCWDKKGGCGVQFKATDPRIEEKGAVVVGDKVWNLHNTILKMSAKRAKVAAILTATAASDIFTQDLEDLEDKALGLGEEAERTQAGTGGGATGGNGSGTTGGSGNGSPKRVTPGQVRDLNAALRDIGVGAEQTLPWINEQRKGQKPLDSIMDLPPDDADRLIKVAKDSKGGA